MTFDYRRETFLAMLNELERQWNVKLEMEVKYEHLKSGDAVVSQLRSELKVTDLGEPVMPQIVEPETPAEPPISPLHRKAFPPEEVLRD